jgi:hypothetical protein
MFKGVIDDYVISSNDRAIILKDYYFDDKY